MTYECTLCGHHGYGGPGLLPITDLVTGDRSWAELCEQCSGGLESYDFYLHVLRVNQNLLTQGMVLDTSWMTAALQPEYYPEQNSDWTQQDE